MKKVKKRTVRQRITRASYIRTVTQVEKKCPVCKRTFWGAKISRFCGRQCRQRANYARHAEQYREARRIRYHEKTPVENFQAPTAPVVRAYDTGEPPTDAP